LAREACPALRDRREGAEEKMTNLKIRRFTACLAAIGVLLFFVGDEYCALASEPIYQGQPESYWVNLLTNKLNSYSLGAIWLKLGSNAHLHKNYIFRVNTALDEKGNIKSAQYGKIYGDFEEALTTYLNAETNSRELEFDMQHNLGAGGKSGWFTY
jgi:hypothetical protein